MKDKKLIILIILAIAAIASLIYGVTSRKKHRVVPTETKRAETKRQKPSAEKMVPRERNMAKTEYTTWKRSPFVPKGSPGNVSGLSLNGIIWDENKPKAMINGIVLGVGEVIQGNTVVEIGKQHAVLNDGEKNFVLKLGS